MKSTEHGTMSWKSNEIKEAKLEVPVAIRRAARRALRKRALNSCGMNEGGTFGKGNSCAGTKGTGKAKKPKQAAAKQTQSNQFKKWFKNSQVVNDKGEPLVVYHGTNKEFSAFSHSAEQQNDAGFAGEGFYFMSSKEWGDGYAEVAVDNGGGNPRTIEAYLRLENPKVITDYAEVVKGRDIRIEGVAQEIAKEIRDLGHDGVILNSKNKTGPNEYMVLDPSQIKSATGNSGEFNSNDPSINRALNSCGMNDGGTFIKGNSCAGTKGTGKKKGLTGKAKEKVLQDFQDGKITVSQVADLLLPPESRASYKKPKTALPFVPNVDPNLVGLSKGQKKFFGASKARGADGKLLTLYHGTDQKFDAFDSPNGGWNMFSTSYNYSRTFAKGWGEVLEVHLDLKNPLDLRSLPRQRGDARNELLDLLKYKTDIDEESFNYLKDYLPHHKDTFQIINNGRDVLIEILIDMGHDGIIFPDITVGKIGKEEYGEIPATTYVAFVASQIKKTSNQNPTKSKNMNRALNSCGMTDGGTFGKGNSCAGTKGTGKAKKPKQVRPKKLVQNLKRAEAKIRNEPMEYSHNFDSKGNLLFVATSGSTEYVDFSGEQVARLKDAVSTHNHPMGGSFSPADVEFAVVADIKELRAVSRETGYTFVLQRPKNGWGEGILEKYQASRKQVVQKVTEQIYPVMSKDPKAKKVMTKEMGNRFMSELVVQDWLAKMLKAGTIPDDMPKYYELIDAKN